MARIIVYYMLSAFGHIQLIIRDYASIDYKMFAYHLTGAAHIFLRKLCCLFWNKTLSQSKSSICLQKENGCFIAAFRYYALQTREGLTTQPLV